MRRQRLLNVRQHSFQGGRRSQEKNQAWVQHLLRMNFLSPVQKGLREAHPKNPSPHPDFLKLPHFSYGASRPNYLTTIFKNHTRVDFTSAESLEKLCDQLDCNLTTSYDWNTFLAYSGHICGYFCPKYIAYFTQLSVHYKFELMNRFKKGINRTWPP